MADLSTIFKAYDIRGLAPQDLGPDEARRIGAAFATFAAAPRIAVGRDCRATSGPLTAALVEGITSVGTDVDVLGEVATDIVYYVAGVDGVPGVMVTASHNPPEWNGMKFCLAGAAPVGEDTGLADIRAMAERGVAGPGGGTVRETDPVAGFIAHLFSVVDPGGFAPLRVAVDGGNGMAGVVVPGVFAATDLELLGLYLEPDGTFPNHPADPLRPENLVDLLALMDREGADVGVAFDGDADRAFFVDERGTPLPGSTTTGIIADWFLAREPGAAIVHNLICSRAVPELVSRAGGNPIRSRVGHSFIKQLMKETGAVFGGEHSGHYYFRDNYRADSGMLAMLVLLRVLSEAGVPLSELRRTYEPYAQSGEINFRVEDKAAALDAAVAAFPDAGIDRLDGVTVAWPDRWFNLRPSNTEPVLRLNVEAPDPAAVTELVDRVGAIVAAPR